MTKSKQITQEIQDSKSASFWLKKAIQDLSKRDICDALRDLETLKYVFELKLKELTDDNTTL